MSVQLKKIIINLFEKVNPGVCLCGVKDVVYWWFTCIIISLPVRAVVHNRFLWSQSAFCPCQVWTSESFNLRTKASLWYWQVLCYWGPLWAVSSPCNFWGWYVAANTVDLILPNYSYLPFLFSLSATMFDTAFFFLNVKCSLFLTGKSHPHCEILEKLCVCLNCFILWNNFPQPDQIW